MLLNRWYYLTISNELTSRFQINLTILQIICAIPATPCRFLNIEMGVMLLNKHLVLCLRFEIWYWQDLYLRSWEKVHFWQIRCINYCYQPFTEAQWTNILIVSNLWFHWTLDKIEIKSSFVFFNITKLTRAHSNWFLSSLTVDYSHFLPTYS